MDPKDIQATGRGAKGYKVEDVSEVLHVHAHDTLLVFATDGRVYAVRAHEVPLGARTAVGTALPRLLRHWGGGAVTTVASFA